MIFSKDAVSAPIYDPMVDLSICDLKDLSGCTIKGMFDGNEVKYGQNTKEYFYCGGNTRPNTFINIYSENNQQVNNNSPVIFDINNFMCGNCCHDPSTSQIMIWKTGFYHIYTNLYHVEECQFALFKNSVHILPGSTIGSMAGTTQNSNVVIIQITSDDMTTETSLSPCGMACQIELINITPTPFVTLYDASSLGYIVPQINATITIHLLCS